MTALDGPDIPETPRRYRFGPFGIDTTNRLLYRDGQSVPLTPKVADTLLVFLSNAGKVVEKEDLMKAVWGPGVFVEEGGLARNISVLRKALGDGDEAKYIETIPKRGYRFIAEVTEITDQKPAIVPIRPPHRKTKAGVVLGILAVIAISAGLAWFRLNRTSAIPGIRSLLILPIENRSPDPSQAYFADSLTDALRSRLAGIRALRVQMFGLPKPGGKTPAEIARSKGADAALEGSVLAAGGKVRISVFLTWAKSGRLEVIEESERDVGDIYTIQSRVAQAVARAIQVQVSPVEQAALDRSRDVPFEAFQAYAQGRRLANQRSGEGIFRGIEFFKLAIEKDHGYAEAYAGLADAWAILGSAPYDLYPPEQSMKQARSYADAAIRLDEELAEAHTSLGYVLLSYFWDLPESRKEFTRALQLKPGYSTAHHWFAHYLLAAGKPQEALEQMQQAYKSEPDSPIIGLGVGWCYYHLQKYDEAIAQYRAVLENYAANPVAHFVLGVALSQKNQFKESADSLQKALELSGGLLAARVALGETYARSGDEAKARQILGELIAVKQKRYVPSLYLAGLSAVLGDRAGAERWGKKAFEERNDYLVYVHSDPKFEALRKIDSFRELLRRNGLPPVE